MKLTLYPEVEAARLDSIVSAAAPMRVVNAANEAEAIREIADSDAFYGVISATLLAAASQLRWIQAPTVSLEHYMFPELIDHPAVLTNMRGFYADTMADHAMGLTIALARHFPVYFRQQQAGLWKRVGADGPVWTTSNGDDTGAYRVTGAHRAHPHLGDCTMGLVGLGAIGREIVHRATAFGLRLLAVDPDQTSAPEGVQLWPLTRLPQLLEESDFIVVTAPHTPETEKMFRRPQFEQMKSTAVLVNISRGALVDLTDLVWALDSGEIAGAALDVAEIEPLPPDHPIWAQPNVIITPHVSAMSPRLAERHLAIVLDNISRYASGGVDKLVNVVDKAKWY
jgi:phosphoglycerate dehydrogenase-like enzyme